jgi:hypothetical protein
MSAAATRAAALRDGTATAPSWRRELLVAAMVGGALFLVTLVPYIVGYVTAPPGRVFNGFFFLGDDGSTYISEIRAGANGAWGWSDPYVSRPVGAPVLLFMLYVLTGKLVAITHLPVFVAFHFARLTGAVALVLAARRLAAAALPSGRTRLVAVTLGLVGSGAGYLLPLAGAILGRADILGQPLSELDLHIPEISGLFSMLTFPHFAWAAALIAFAVVELMLLASSSGARVPPATVVRAAISMLALTFIHPQMLVVLFLLAVVMVVAFRTGPRRVAWMLVPFAICSPAFLYFAYILTSDPVVSAYARQWQQGPYAVLPTLFAFGFPLVLAVAGVIVGRRRLTPPQLVLAAWAGLVLVLLYLPAPVSIQRRLFDGIFLPIGVLAALGVEVLARRRQGVHASRRVAVYAVAACTVTSLLLLAAPVSMAAARIPDLYLDDSEAQAMDWLGGQVGQGTPPAVMCVSGTGLFIPARAGWRVYTGNYALTIDSAARDRAAAAAIRAGGNTLVDLMRAQDTGFLFVGPRERASGVGPIDSALQAVYDRDGVQVYQLRG